MTTIQDRLLEREIQARACRLSAALKFGKPHRAIAELDKLRKALVRRSPEQVERMERLQSGREVG